MVVEIIMGLHKGWELRGDINKDGKTDAADIVTLVNILNGK